MREVDFSDRTVAQRWRAIKPSLREDLIPWTRHLLKRLLESSLDEELEAHLGAAWHARHPERQGYRNGAYTRDLTTELGLLRALQVPRARTAGFQPQVFLRYQRRQPQVNRLLCAAFISGVSTRQVGPLTALLLEDAVSASTVSRVTQSLDAEVRRFHAQPLQDRYDYLLLDGITLKVKTPTGCRKRLVLCAYGLTPHGHRELLSFRQVRAESEATWTAFLTDLAQRGLVGAALRLIVTDGQPGLLAALGPQAPQRGGEAAPAASRDLPRGGEGHLPGRQPARRRPGLPSVGRPLARGCPRRGGVSGARHRGAPRLLDMSRRALADDPDDERDRARVPGGAPTDAADELLHERGELRPDHLCGDPSSQHDVGATPSRAIYTKGLTLPRADPSSTALTLLRVQAAETAYLASCICPPPPPPWYSLPSEG